MCCCISWFELKSIVYGFCFMKGFNNLSGCLRILDEHFVLKRRLLLTPYTWFLLVHFIYHICMLGFNLSKLKLESYMVYKKKLFWIEVKDLDFIVGLENLTQQHCFEGGCKSTKKHKKCNSKNYHLNFISINIICNEDKSKWYSKQIIKFHIIF